MIRSWLLPNGNVKHYDTVTDTVQEMTIDNVNVVPVSPATELDREEYNFYFPAASPEEITARTDVSTQLGTAIQVLIDAKVDFLYSKETLDSIQSQVASAIESYKNFEYTSNYVDKMAVTLMSELSSYQTLVLEALDARLSAAVNTALLYQPKIDELEYRLGLLEGN
jgi:hypothetical protein